VVRRVIDLGYHPIIIGRHPPVLEDKCEFIEADLLLKPDYNSIMRIAQATHLIHLAWYAEHEYYLESPINFNWVSATVDLVEAFAKNGGQRIVFGGTCAEYDRRHGYLVEDVTPSNPSSIYGVAKNATMQLTNLQCRSYGVSYAWARIFFPFGLGEKENRLVPTLIKIFDQRLPLVEIACDAYRDFMAVQDLADGLCELLSNNIEGLVNLCSGEPIRISQIIKEIAGSMGVSAIPLLEFSKNKIPEFQMIVGDSSLMRKAGWTPKVKISDALYTAVKSTVLLPIDQTHQK